MIAYRHAAINKLLPHLLLSPEVFSRGALVSITSALFFSTSGTSIVGDKPILVRDFIKSALYDPKHGYFSQRSGSVGLLENSIKFNQLQGRRAYMQYLDKIYKQNDIAWFTPVELFKLHHSHHRRHRQHHNRGTITTMKGTIVEVLMEEERHDSEVFTVGGHKCCTPGVCFFEEEEELIREEEAVGQTDWEEKAKRAATEKEKRAMKKQGSHKHHHPSHVLCCGISLLYLFDHNQRQLTGPYRCRGNSVEASEIDLSDFQEAGDSDDRMQQSQGANKLRS